MAGGKRYKFQGTSIQFATNFEASSPSGAIGAATNDDPVVVTQTAHGQVNGDVGRVVGAEGMTELNDGTYIIQRLSADTYSLLGIDGTDYGTYTQDGQIDFAPWSDLCELTGFNRQGGSSPEIPASTICSEAEEIEIGLPSFGTVQIDYNFAPLTTAQAALQDAYESGELIGIKVTLPKNAGILVMLGFVQQTSEAAQVNGIWTASATIRLTGKRYDFVPA